MASLLPAKVGRASVVPTVRGFGVCAMPKLPLIAVTHGPSGLSRPAVRASASRQGTALDRRADRHALRFAWIRSSLGTHPRCSLGARTNRGAPVHLTTAPPGKAEVCAGASARSQIVRSGRPMPGLADARVWHERRSALWVRGMTVAVSECVSRIYARGSSRA